MSSEISARLDAVIQRQRDVVWHVDGLVARDQRGQSDDAAVAWREARALPQLGDGALRVLVECRSDHPEIVPSITVAYLDDV